MKKKILLIYKNENLSLFFEEELKKIGYEVHSFYQHPIDYTEWNFFDKIYNIYRRIFFKDTSYVIKKHQKIFENISFQQLKKIKKSNLKFDYALVIHMGMIPEKVLQYVRSISNEMVDYQSDGLENYPDFFSKTEFFDRIYVFDYNDVVKYPQYRLNFISNFYIEDENYVKDEIYDMFYIGVISEERRKILEKINENLPHLKNKMILSIPEFRNFENKNGIEYIKKYISYNDNIEFVKKSKVLIDLKRPEHEGLSFRFFEAMAYDKKVMTNNENVKNYDFYHPNNILVTDYSDYQSIVEFLEKPFVPIPKEIKKQYSFNSWIKKVLENQ